MGSISPLSSMKDQDKSHRRQTGYFLLPPTVFEKYDRPYYTTRSMQCMAWSIFCVIWELKSIEGSSMQLRKESDVKVIQTPFPDTAPTATLREFLRPLEPRVSKEQ